MSQTRFLSAVAAAFVVTACTESSPPVQEKVGEAPVNNEAPSLALDEQRNAYAMGASLARQMKASGMALDKESFLAGINDVLDGGKPRIDEQEMETRVKGVQEQERFRRVEEVAARNRAESENFLTANASAEGVLVTDSGLQYQVIEPGEGARPSAADIVTVHYRGTLLDGTEFDSSYSRNQPASFALNRVIKGWTEGLQLMAVGSKYKFFIPSDLAYGRRGSGELIGPDAALMFEVTLLEAKTAP